MSDLITHVKLSKVEELETLLRETKEKAWNLWNEHERICVEISGLHKKIAELEIELGKLREEIEIDLPGIKKIKF